MPAKQLTPKVKDEKERQSRIALWRTLIVITALTAIALSLALPFAGGLALPAAASSLIGSGVLVGALFVIINALGAAALLSSMRSLFSKNEPSENPKKNSLRNLLWMGVRAALVVAMTLSWVPFIMHGGLLSIAGPIVHGQAIGGSALFKLFNGLFHFGTAHAGLPLLATVGILAACALAIAALGKLF